ncbi:hypothetical protein J3E73DRAFT_420523 [Bipolaris maydis]|nr:hypothetical protein J3E73DRAFT_420523 [Bipolaris maydis]
MRLTPLTLALSTLSTTSAFISGITLPATIAPNKPYTITFDAKVDPYSMWTDVAVTWGYNSPPGSTNTVPVKPVTTAPDGIQKFNKERKVDIVATVFTVGQSPAMWGSRRLMLRWMLGIRSIISWYRVQDSFPCLSVCDG